MGSKHAETRLADIRNQRAMSAAELARAVGVSRQTVYAIEDGSYVPNTLVALRMARVLGVTVEELFRLSDFDEQVEAPFSVTWLKYGPGDGPGGFARLVKVNGNTIAVPAQAQQAFLPQADTWSETRDSVLKSGTREWDDSKRILLAGCDPGLSLLGDLLKPMGVDLVCVSSSSVQALRWLKDGMVHGAGSHLKDKTTGEYNLPAVRKLFPHGGVTLVSFALWEQGLVVKRTNPKSIRQLADLARPDIVMVNREKGAGARDLVDNGLKNAGIVPTKVQGYDTIAHGHLAAAWYVAAGQADCCVASRAAARVYGLDFIALSYERFDVCLPAESLELASVRTLLDALSHAALRMRLHRLAGYDTANTGKVVL